MANLLLATAAAFGGPARSIVAGVSGAAIAVVVVCGSVGVAVVVRAILCVWTWA